MTRHRRPEAEIAFVNGIMELLSDDPSRAREILASITPEAFVVDHAAETLAALTDTLTEIDTPGPADLLATVRRAVDDPEDVVAFIVDRLRDGSRQRCAFSLGIHRHAHEVMLAHRQRLALQAVDEFRAVAADPASTTADLEAAAKAIPAAVEAVVVPSPGWRETGLDLLDGWARTEATPVIETGFRPLDGILGGGLPAGGLVVFGALPGAGKSALAIQATLGALELDPGLRAVYALGEMSAEAFARRMIAHWSNKPGRRAVTMSEAKRRSPQARKVAVDLANKVASRLAIVRPPLSIQRIEAAVVASKATLLVVDFLQLVEIDGAADRRAEIDGIVRWLRRVTLQHGVTAIAITNLAKNVTEATRIGSIAKESSEIDFAADLFLLGIPEEQLDVDGRRPVRWACKKQKDGVTIDLETLFDGRTQTFEDNGTPILEEFAGFAPMGETR